MSTNTLAELPDGITVQWLQPQDAAMLFAQVERNRLHLRQWLPWLDDNNCLADSQFFIQLAEQDKTRGKSHTFAVRHQQALIGVCSLDAIDQKQGVANVGYWLSEDYCGQGIMTRSVKALLDFAFATLELQQLRLNTAEGNLKSRAIAERLGFSQRYKIPKAEDLYGEWVDHIRYTKTRQQWLTDYDTRNQNAGTT